MSDQWDRKWSKSDYSGAKWRKPFQKEEMNNSVKYCQHVEQDEDEGMTQIWQHGSHCWRFVWGVVRMIDCTEYIWQRMGEAQIVPSFPWDPLIHFTLTTLHNYTYWLISLSPQLSFEQLQCWAMFHSSCLQYNTGTNQVLIKCLLNEYDTVI